MGESYIGEGRTALITGITGQDGSFLSELLLSKGYVVHGIVRRASTFNTERLDAIYADPHESGARLHLHYGDMADGASLRKILQQAKPSEIYNLAAQSHVRVSFDQAEYTADVVATGTLRLLEAVREYADAGNAIRFYQAGSSEMFGASPPPQDEDTPFYPRSPYAVGKVAGHWFAKNYREAYGLFIVNGILFNHESPLRGREFVTRKITDSAAKIRLGKLDCLELGNLDAKRDWGYAKEYVDGMWRMLQADEPDTFVLATHRCETVRDFARMAFSAAGYTLEFIGQGVTERAVDMATGKTLLAVNPKFYRPTEVDLLIGDPSRARDKLGWEPETRLEALCRMMVEADLARNASGVSF